MDILGSEGAILNLQKGKMLLLNCEGTEMDLLIKAKDNVRVQRLVRTKTDTVIPPNTITQIPIQTKGKRIPDDRDLLFTSNKDGIYNCVMDSNTHYVLVHNMLTNHLRF